jgi:hypothetical protein
MTRRTNLNKQAGPNTWKKLVERVESVNEQEKEIELVVEDEGVEETVLAHVEGLQSQRQQHGGSDTIASRCVYKRRIRCIGICVLTCVLGMLWGVDKNDCKIEVKNWLPPRY